MNLDVYITTNSNIILKVDNPEVFLEYPPTSLYDILEHVRYFSPVNPEEIIIKKTLENLSEDDVNLIKNYVALYDPENNSVDYYYKEDKDAVLWKQVRLKRDQLLRESDEQSFITLPDYWNQKSDAWKTDWLNYRQALRDITHSVEDPADIVWPEKPNPVL